MFIKLNGVLNKNVQKMNKNVQNDTNVDISLSSSTENIVSSVDNNSLVDENLCSLKKIRIGNTLSQFNKRETLSFKEELSKLQELLSNSKYSSFASLILDGELKAKGNDYLLFMYTVNNLESLFNNSLNNIEEMFKYIYNSDYRVIAVNSQEWDEIKSVFNKSMREKKQVYKYIEENNIIKNEKIVEQNNTVLKTPIDNLFEDIVQYN